MRTETGKSSTTTVRLRLLCWLVLPFLLYCIPLENVLHGHSICLFRNLLGRECYGCGMTRALFSALHLDFQAAWEYNRAVVAAGPILLYLYVKEVVRGFRRLASLRRSR